MPPIAGRGIALALAACCGAAHADARLDFAAEGDCPTLFRSIEIAGPRLRFEAAPAGGGETASIFDGDEDLVTALLPSQRTFMRIEVDADAADYSGDVASSSVKFMDRQLARAKQSIEQSCSGGRCPQIPDLDAMMRAALPAVPPIEAHATGQADTVGGVACEWREWRQSGQVVRRECLADVADLPLPERDRAGLRRGMRVMLHFSDAYAPMRDRFGLAPEPEWPVGKLPLAQACFAGGAPSGRATLSLREAPVDPARFEVPAGYAPMAGPGAD